MLITKVPKPDQLNATTMAHILRVKVPELEGRTALDLMQYVLDVLVSRGILDGEE